jgi:hypothetical protein
MNEWRMLYAVLSSNIAKYRDISLHPMYHNSNPERRYANHCQYMSQTVDGYPSAKQTSQDTASMQTGSSSRLLHRSSPPRSCA